MDIIKNNIANILTVTRLLLLPFIIALFYWEASITGNIGKGAVAWLTLLIYAAAATTDFFDGYIARKLNQISDFGTFLDPISDKIFVATILILLVAFGRIEGAAIILVILIFAREFLVSGLREFLGPKNIKVPVSKTAKWKTSFQMLSLGFLIIGPYSPYATELGIILLTIATILTLITGIIYMIIGFKHMKDQA